MGQLTHSFLALQNTDVEKSALRKCYKNLFLKFFCTAGGNVKKVQLLQKTLRQFLKKLKTESPKDPTIIFLLHNPNNLGS